MIVPKDDEMYGLVISEHYGRRYDVLCADGTTRNCNKRTKVPKMFPGESVVIVEPGLQKHKGRICYRYNKFQSSNLKMQIFGDI